MEAVYINFIETSWYAVVLNPTRYDKFKKFEEFSEKFHPTKCKMCDK